MKINNYILPISPLSLSLSFSLSFFLLLWGCLLDFFLASSFVLIYLIIYDGVGKGTHHGGGGR